MTALFGSQDNLSSSFIRSAPDGGMPIAALRDPEYFGWDVSNDPLVNSATGEIIPDHKVANRINQDGTIIPIGVVGKKRSKYPNSQIFDFLEEMERISGATFTVQRMGHQKHGGICWVQVRVDGEPFRPLPGDEIYREWIIGWGHGGLRLFCGAGSTFRPICNNQSRQMLGDMKNNTMWAFKASANTLARTDEFLEFQGEEGLNWQSYKAMCDHLLTVNLTAGRWNGLLDTVLPCVRPDGTKIADRVTKREAWTDALENAPGQDIRGMQSTGYAGLQAIAYHYSNEAITRESASDTSEWDAVARRWVSNMKGPEQLHQAVNCLINM